MKKIRITAVVIAFVAELGLDQIIATILFVAFGHTDFSPDMSDADKAAFATAVWSDGGFMLVAFFCGTATTVLGGYLCARIAKTYPYYNGLAIGIVGIVWTLLPFGESPWWYTALGVLMSLPASIYGAHLAKAHIAAAS
jgi:hypothetical protein